MKPTNYRARGDAWCGYTPHDYMVSVVRKGITEWKRDARKRISFESA